MRWPTIILLGLLVAACRTPLPVPGMRIEGNQRVGDDDLAEAASRHLEAYRRNDGRLADADDASYAMESYLRREGHSVAKVRFDVEQGVLVFHVTEGPKAYFGRVRFAGVHSVDECELLPFFDFEGSGMLWLKAPVLDPAKVESAVSSVETYYRDHGYQRVDVAELELDPSDDRRTVDVVVKVDEGPLYRVSDVVVTGAPKAVLEDESVIGMPYAQGLAFKMAGRVRRKLRDQGYAFAKVRGTPDTDDETATVRILLHVERGDLTRLRGLDIKGNCQTKTGFIRKRFALRKGGVIRRSMFERGVADLYRSGLFSSVQTALEPSGPAEADLTIDVEEAATKRVDVEVGWGSWEQLRGRVEYKDFNLFGWGRVLRASALASMKAYGGELELEDPWILGQDNRLWWNVNGLIREERFYDYRGVGTSLGFEHRFSRRSKVWGAYRFRLEEGTAIDADIPPDVRAEIEGFERSAGLVARGRIDTRDDLFLPRKGWHVEIGAFWSTPGLGASLDYLELDGRATCYLDFGSWGVLAVGAMAATRQPLSDTILPIQQHYFVGGPQSVRSFGQDELTPMAQSGQGIGGLTAAEGHVEWRRKIVDVIHGALFYDVGFVSEDPFSLRGIVGHGVGAGLRFYAPVGPVRFDAAYNPGALYAAGNRWQFIFSFGFSF